MRTSPTEPPPKGGRDSTEFCARVLRVLADDTRLAAVRVLMQGPRRVGQINELLGVEQSLLSHHLRVLRQAGIVTAERHGKAMLYRLALPARLAGEELELGCCRIRFRSTGGEG